MFELGIVLMVAGLATIGKLAHQRSRQRLYTVRYSDGRVVRFWH